MATKKAKKQAMKTATRTVKKPDTKKPKQKPAKKPVRQATKSKALVAQPQVIPTISYSEIVKPETYQGKYTLIPTPFTTKQIEHLISPTPPKYIKQRPGKGGGTWSYIPGWYAKKKVNFITGFMNSFAITDKRIDGNFITVSGRLTILDRAGKEMMHKEDFGGAEIKFKKGTKEYLDISNDFKAAATDCFKRCAAQLGIGADLQAIGEYESNIPDAPVAPANPSPTGTIAHVEVLTHDDSGIDYLKALENFLEQKGFNTDAKKAAIINKHTFLQIYKFADIKPMGAKAILNQLRKKI